MPSTQWKIRNFRERWYAGETISVAIGQGATTVTPLQLAIAIGGISIGGMWFQPHLAKDEVHLMPARRAEFNPGKYPKSDRWHVRRGERTGGTGGRAQDPRYGGVRQDRNRAAGLAANC